MHRVFLNWIGLGLAMLAVSGCRLVMDIPEGPPPTGNCGDGVIQENELCDGLALGGKTCEALGFGPGTLVCNASCDGFITLACAAKTCGNGSLDRENGEVCDGDLLDGKTCESLGHYPGTLACLSTCTGFDMSACGGSCGDGVIQNAVEECDGNQLGGLSCRGFGYFTGDLVCKPSCHADDSNCLYAQTLQAGFSHACVTLSDDSVRCWGDNTAGQLGDGTTTNRPSPVLAQTPFRAVQVAGGVDHTCALDIDGSVWCWGQNEHGQLGDGTTVSHTAPVRVAVPASVNHVAAGAFFTCAATSGGTVFCWGINSSGQLGIGTQSQYESEPASVADIHSATRVTAGWMHACALLNSGEVYCWGNNAIGQIGDGTTTNRLSPVAVQSLFSVTKISAANYHTCAMSSMGAAFCWGYNEYGQLGDGTTITRTAPVSVQFSGLNTILDISAGGNTHSCAILDDGSAACWGQNEHGQLGDGTTTTRISPVIVPDSNGLTQVSVGEMFSCVLSQVGRVWCWGFNDSGQLGDGTADDRLGPVEVLP